MRELTIQVLKNMESIWNEISNTYPTQKLAIEKNIVWIYTILAF